MPKPIRLLRCAALSLSMLAAAAMAAPASAHSLKQALASAYLESGLLDQNRALLRAADEDVAVAIAALRPVIRYAASTTRSYSDGGASNPTTTQALSLTADMLIYDFGRSPLAVEAAKANVLATRHSLISVEQQVLARAVAAYMNLRAERSSAELQRNNLRLLREEFRAAQDRFEVGEITRTDVAFAEARVAASQAQLAAAEAGVDAAEAEYRAAIGTAAPDHLDVPPNQSRPVATMADARAQAVRRHPDILAAQQNVTAAELNIRRAELATRPTLSAQGRLSAQRGNAPGTDGENASIGLQVTGPIYQGGQLAAARRQAAAQRDASRAALHLTTLAVEQNLANAWANLEAAEAGLAASREQAQASQTAFNGIREEARLGSRTTLDVLDAEQDLLNARSAVITSETNRQIATYQLLQAMGLLTAERLGLDVPIYDPTVYYNLARSAPAPSSERGQQLDELLRRLGD